MSPPHILILLTVCLFWGSNFVVAKTGLTEFSPLFFSAIRFFFLALILIPLLKWQKGQMKAILAIAMFSGALHFALFFWGLSVATASVSAIVAQLGAPFGAVLSILFLGEHVGWRRWSGIGMAFFGVAILSFDPTVFQYLTGVILMATASLCYATAQLFMKQLKGVKPLDLQVWVGVISFPILGILSLLIESGQVMEMSQATWRGWSAVLYTTLAGSIIGHSGVFYLLQRYDVSLVSGQLLLAPVIGIFMGVMILGEPITGRIVVGGLITLVGVGILAIRQGQVAPKGAKPAAALPSASGVEALSYEIKPETQAAEELTEDKPSS